MYMWGCKGGSPNTVARARGVLGPDHDIGVSLAGTGELKDVDVDGELSCDKFEPEEMVLGVDLDENPGLSTNGAVANFDLVAQCLGNWPRT